MLNQINFCLTNDIFATPTIRPFISLSVCMNRELFQLYSLNIKTNNKERKYFEHL